MNTTDVLVLADADLDLVGGGEDSNYKFCWNGPAGAGTYPLYIKCNDGVGSSYGSQDLAKDLAGALGGARPA